MPDYDLFIKQGLNAGFTDAQLNFLEAWVFDYLPDPDEE